MKYNINLLFAADPVWDNMAITMCFSAFLVWFLVFYCRPRLAFDHISAFSLGAKEVNYSLSNLKSRYTFKKACFFFISSVCSYCASLFGGGKPDNNP